IGATAAICVLSLWLVGHLPPLLLLVASLVLGRVAFLKYVRLPFDEPHGASETPWRAYMPMTYALCCFGLAGVVVVAPTTALFAGAYDHTVERLVAAEQEAIFLQTRSNPDCVVAGDGSVQCPLNLATGAALSNARTPASAFW